MRYRFISKRHNKVERFFRFNFFAFLLFAVHFNSYFVFGYSSEFRLKIDCWLCWLSKPANKISHLSAFFDIHAFCNLKRMNFSSYFPQYFSSHFHQNDKNSISFRIGPPVISYSCHSYVPCPVEIVSMYSMRFIAYWRKIYITDQYMYIGLRKYGRNAYANIVNRHIFTRCWILNNKEPVPDTSIVWFFPQCWTGIIRLQK